MQQFFDCNLDMTYIAVEVSSHLHYDCHVISRNGLLFVQSTRQACYVTGTRLVEVSIELVKKDESHFQEIQHALSTSSSLFDDGYMNIDVTGVVSQDVAPCLVDFKKSLHGQVTVDASSLLVG
jgi:hypothetical protein